MWRSAVYQIYPKFVCSYHIGVDIKIVSYLIFILSYLYILLYSFVSVLSYSAITYCMYMCVCRYVYIYIYMPIHIHTNRCFHLMTLNLFFFSVLLVFSTMSGFQEQYYDVHQNKSNSFSTLPVKLSPFYI